MRDDLHHSLPPRSVWRQVVKHAYREIDRPTLPAAIVDAARQEFGRRVSDSWLEHVDSEIGRAAAGLFGADLLPSIVDEAERIARSSEEREICEALRASDSGTLADALDSAIANALKQYAVGCVEQVIVRIASERGEFQSAQLRRVLMPALGASNFSSSGHANEQDSSANLLEMRLPVRVGA
ncbi:hypothetical protein [Burkholderia contaminans]|uniref:hypothetical protein n=1 Tax=Burkholderia contaminans TaxID=488447 RepID=UPI000F569102|nr:hypothetical protein [Burkholderia contaminans]